MKRNRFLLTILCFVLILSIFSSSFLVFAIESNKIATASQIAANAPSALSTIQMDITANDEMKIWQIVTLLFDIKREQFANGNVADFDFSLFGPINTTIGADLLYFSRSVKAEKDTLKIFDRTVTDCKTDLTFKSITIDGNEAVVEVYEWLSYYYCTPDKVKAAIISGVGVDYNIEMKKSSAGWQILGIDFYNEATEELRNNRIWVSAFVQSRYKTVLDSANNINSEGKAFGMTEATRSNPESYISFVGIMSCTYACLYGGNKRNENFPDFSDYGGDCQNFASQCIWYGLLDGEYTSIPPGGGDLPMINSSIGGSAGRSWYVLPDGSHSASWTGVSSFYNYVESGGYPNLGLCGNEYIGVANAKLGDIVQICDSSGNFYHSYIVVNAFGEIGSRTLSDIYISAHTTDRFNEPLSNLISSSNRTRTISITGAYTP